MKTLYVGIISDRPGILQTYISSVPIEAEDWTENSLLIQDQTSDSFTASAHLTIVQNILLAGGVTVIMEV